MYVEQSQRPWFVEGAMLISRTVLSAVFGAVVLPVLLAAGEAPGSGGLESKSAEDLPQPPTRIANAGLKAQACLECHDEMTDLFLGDKHVGEDFHCVVCHGESKAHLEMEVEGTLPDRAWRRWIEEEGRFEWRMENASLEIARFCASCHGVKPAPGHEIKTIRWKGYLKSPHGLAVRDGDHDGPTCTDCHYAHGAGAEPLTDETVVQRCGLCHGDREMMKRLDLDPDVMEDFQTKTHANMGEASPEENSTCIRCHYPH